MSISRLTTNGLTGTKYDTVSADNYYMEPIATTLLGSSATNITFSNIPSGYKHLQIRYIARSDYAGYADGIKFQFNADTGSNYSDHTLYGNGTAAGATADVSAAYIRTYQTAAANSVANAFGAGIIDILDYSNVYKYKTSRMLTGFDNNNTGGGGEIDFTSGLWMNTASITSIKFMPTNATNFVANSRFSLYGIKG
jgi:hypothetical protein